MVLLHKDTLEHLDQDCMVVVAVQVQKNVEDYLEVEGYMVVLEVDQTDEMKHCVEDHTAVDQKGINAMRHHELLVKHNHDHFVA